MAQLADALGHSAAGDDWLAAVAAESAAAATRAGLLRLSDCDTSAFAEALRDATAAVHVLEGALATSALAGSPGGAHLQHGGPPAAAATTTRRRSLASHAAAAALGAALTAVVAAMAPQLGRALAAAWATVLRKLAAAAAA